MAATLRPLARGASGDLVAAWPPALADDPYRNRYLIAIAVTLASVLELIDTSIVNVALPDMMGNLGATLDEIAWVSTGYIIANVIVIPMSGWLSAYFGRRKYLAGSIMLFVVASFLCGAAHTLVELVVFRIVQGVGGGALLSTAQATLFESFPPEEVGIGQAIFGVGVMVGPTIGPTLGGWIVDNYQWPWIFYINVPLGILAAILVLTYVRNAAHQERSRTVDVAGIALLTTCIGSLQWMLERGERNDWFESRFIVTLLVVSIASAVLLVWRELTAKEPVIDFRVLKSRQLTAGVLIAAMLGVALYGSVFVLPLFLQQLHGMTAWQTGKIILPGALASAVTMGIVGRNANRLDARLTLDAGANDMFWPLIWRGTGLGLIFVPLTNATMADLKTERLAQGTGMFNLTRQLGGSLGIAVMATLLVRFAAQHRVALVSHLASGDAASMARLSALTQGMVAKGASLAVAKQQALALLDGQVMAQANVLAFSRIYLLCGLLLCAALPLLFVFKSGKGRGAMGPVH
jgi:DHA2 family multidrug resistance protein